MGWRSVWRRVLVYGAVCTQIVEVLGMLRESDVDSKGTIRNLAFVRRRIRS